MPGTDAPITDQERTTAIASERLVCVDPADNNNKFYNAFVLADGTFASEHGRVSETNKIATNRWALSEPEAIKKLEKETKKKMNYKPPKKQPYVRQRTIGSAPASTAARQGKAVSSSAVKSTAVQEISFGGNAQLRKLITWLADVNIHTITTNTNISYDAATGSFSTPLGPVTQDAIDDARGLLAIISTPVRKKKIDDQATMRIIGDYLQIIPQDVGMKRGWHHTLFGHTDSMQKQSDLLDSLAASIQTVAPAPKTKTAAKAKRVFDVKLELVDDKKTVDKIRRKFKSDRGSHSDVASLDVKQVFTIQIASVKDAFEKDGRKLSNIKQLWHGCKASSLLSILKSGLLIFSSSASHATGQMWRSGTQNGIYFSDQSTKSLRYATNAWGYGGNIDRTFMFLASVGCGKQHIPRSGDSWEYRMPAGYDSCFAKGGVSGVSNNEYVIYRPGQCNLDFLCEFTPRGR